MDAFLRLSPRLRDILRRCVAPVPEVKLNATAEGYAEADEIRRRFYELLRVRSKDAGAVISPREWLCVIAPLQKHVEALEQVVKQERYPVDNSPWREIFTFATAIRAFAEKDEKKVFGWFLVDLLEEVLIHSQIDERIFWYDVQGGPAPGGKWGLTVRLHCTKPVKMMLDVDHAPRPAFRLTLFYKPPKVTQISWPKSQLGLTYGRDQFPVYMQYHVLEQLKRRVPTASPISVTMSLSEPVFTKLADNKVLVEYRSGERKLGYFVGMIIGEAVLLKTFLFLTMQGTPESDLLYRKLRLTRSDIEYLHLDELSLFTDPVIQNDPVLRRLCKECGCGHLLDIDSDDAPDERHRRDAETLKKYLSHNEFFRKAAAEEREPVELPSM